MDPEPSSFLAIFTVIDTVATTKIIVLFILLVCSALISGAEVAFFTVNEDELEEGNGKNKRDKLVLKLLETPKKLFNTILIFNNLVNIAFVLLFSASANYFFGPLSSYSLGGVELKFVVEVIVAAFLILMFGEILPKIYVTKNQLKFVRFIAPSLNLLAKILSPVSIPMRNANNYFQEKWGRQKSNLSVDQLSQALELTSEEDTTSEEQKILQGIVTFGNTETRQVMTPRIDVFALSEDTKFSEVFKEIVKNGYSRIPVYSEHMDNITGVLYVKDVLPHIDKKSFNWVLLKREAYFVPENKKLDDLLLEFQEMKSHLAIVVDEYGGTSGLITLEDIIEEIVGDISDEFDDEDLIYSKLDDRNFVFEGKTTLKDFYRVIQLEDESLFEENKGESETIAGFILEIAGSFPKKGEKINYENYTFVVEALDKKRIKQIKLTIN
ncbi:gliding motility-associated protein GldE [Zhouia spongiae]|uniref:Gliding motility-associated protein GldE n=1 Tax=Zhouia spongiae TaxID=2202721 RepID=A0ABY3YPN2_9FLAO|nr:gliding motility-associated protein GldE [Zhouia spongiae]UNY99542.1 gliding motility-associated protein GldE [Zhouia spongiae]